MLSIVGLGGTINSNSSTESALGITLDVARRAGASTRLFGSDFLLSLPHYGTSDATRSGQAAEFITAIRSADGIVIASPGYHGTVSGLVKNAIDYLEETARDQRPYLDGVPVGLIVTAFGWQATGSTLMAMRSIVHALRGWPTPMGAAIKAEPGLFAHGHCTDQAVVDQLERVADQVVGMARLQAQLRGRPAQAA